VNPADFMLDVVGGDVPPDWKAAHPEFTPTSLFSLWEAKHFMLADLALEVGLRGGGTSAARGGQPPGKDRPLSLNSDAARGSERGGPPAHEPVSFFRLVWLYFTRALSQQLRHPGILALNNGLVFLSALFLAAVYFGAPSYAAPEPVEAFTGCPDAIAKPCQICLAAVQDSVLNRGVMTIISLSLTGVASFLPVFGAERVVYWREASALPQPRHTLAYFLGKDLSNIPQLFIGPLIFNMAYEALTVPRGSFGEYYAVFLGVYFVASAFAHVTAVLSPPSLAQLMGVTVIFSNAMFAGGQPTLKQMYDKFIPLRFMPYISYMRYALEAVYVMEVSNYEAVVSLQGIDLAQLVDNSFGYQLSSYHRNVAILFAFGVGLRIVAVVLMMLKDRDRKK
ncbi:hypothetical protein EON62_03490, partial [archaeon]